MPTIGRTVVSETPHFAKRKPRRCRVCGSTRVVAILYGYPTPDVWMDAEAGRVALGGCCLTGADPSWRCLDCHTPIYPERLRQLHEGSPEAFQPRRAE